MWFMILNIYVQDIDIVLGAMGKKYEWTGISGDIWQSTTWYFNFYFTVASLYFH